MSLNPISFGIAFAIISVLIMLVLGILGMMGLHLDAVEQMKNWHLFFSLTPSGILAGMAESAIVSFILGWIFAYLYNKFLKISSK